LELVLFVYFAGKRSETDGRVPLMFDSIILAYDGSENSKKAALAARELAFRFRAKLEAVNVMELPKPVVTVEIVVPISPSTEQSVRREALMKLEEARELLDAGNHPLTTLLEGAPGPSIVEHAKRLRCDLIVVGQRGLNRLEQLLVGSVSRHIVRHAHCPVLVIKDHNSPDRDL
jgi:nucleotide-binding universal stress UspA family protein